MNISIGIVGLPNVGKSTLFNALTSTKVDAQNYPFCTIEPNKGIVQVHDKRINVLADLVKTKSKVPAVIEFVDIAGLVKGASKGEGLGNQFLGNIREVAAIAHVVRDFEDDNVIHVEGGVDPKRDVEVIETELMLKDIETVEKKIDSIKRIAKLNKDAAEIVEYLEKMVNHMSEGGLAFSFENSSNENIQKARNDLFLLTDKPFIYVINSTEAIPKVGTENMNLHSEFILPLDIKLEAELSELTDEERTEYMQEFGIDATGLQKLSQNCYKILDLISFFTAGEQEVRAWTIKKGSKAPQAAGVIHTDFEKNFIAAEVVAYDDFVKFGGWLGAREAGKVRLEGREYIFKEGDVVLFKHN